MLCELPVVALVSALFFALLGFWLRRRSPLGPAILLGGLAAICAGLWWRLHNPGGDLDTTAQGILLLWALLPGLAGAATGVALAWWRVRG